MIRLNRTLFLWLAIGWTVAMFVACSWPGKDAPNLSNNDKWGHALMFAIFAVLWMLTKRKTAVWVLGVGIAYGLFTEVWQGVMPIGRSFDWYDLLADAVGVVIGVGVASLVMRND
ncbi:MAG: VanZ family protein [Cytophagales bacterium]|nr:MAG: VanZ family protein [Cytophagales bacterium]